MSACIRCVRMLLAAAGICIAIASPARGQYLFGGPFALTSIDGHPVTEASFRGKWMIIYFGYRSCPDICPTVLTEVGTALDKLGPLADKIQAVFVTLDPVRDTPSALRDYLASFDRRILGLRGTGDETQAVAKSFHVYYRMRRLGNGEYAVDHSSFLYIVRPDGGFGQLLAGDLPGHTIADTLRPMLR